MNTWEYAQKRAIDTKSRYMVVIDLGRQAIGPCVWDCAMNRRSFHSPESAIVSFRPHKTVEDAFAEAVQLEPDMGRAIAILRFYDHVVLGDDASDPGPNDVERFCRITRN